MSDSGSFDTERKIERKSPSPGSVHLSIVIPARNEARRLPGTLEKISKFLADQNYSAEIIVVDNDSSDGTSDVANEFAARNPWLPLTVLLEPKRGKGAAVRTGMLHGTGEVLFLCDADLSIPIQEMTRFLALVPNAVDIAVGSRERIGAAQDGEPVLRRMMGRTCNVIIKLLGLTELNDTQCGFKAFRKSVAHDLFACQRVAGWGFDIEILATAKRRLYSVAPVPISWSYDADSRVRPIRDAAAMLQEILAIRRRLNRGDYDQRRPLEVTIEKK